MNITCEYYVSLKKEIDYKFHHNIKNILNEMLKKVIYMKQLKKLQKI